MCLKDKLTSDSFFPSRMQFFFLLKGTVSMSFSGRKRFRQLSGNIFPFLNCHGEIKSNWNDNIYNSFDSTSEEFETMSPGICIKLFDSWSVSIVSSSRLISVISTLVSASSFIKSGADPYWSIMSTNPELSAILMVF